MSIKNIMVESPINVSNAKFGENHPGATMTVAIVKKIRKAQRLRNALTDKALARRYGITPKAVKDVMARKRWKHVQ